MSRGPLPILVGALVLALCTAPALDGCRRTGQVNPGGTGGGTNLWTWMGGSNTAGGAGVYGTQGSAAATNLPGARQGAASWRDASGNLWMFGGYGVDGAGNAGYLNDLWRYSPSTAMWTWVGGSNVVDVPGSYGSRTVGSSGNLPGSRSDAATWTDAQGRFWMMGGNGYDANGVAFYPLNDLWEFDPNLLQWTWQAGGSTFGTATASYGTQGTAAAGNEPGGRSQGQAWVDAAGLLWLFGGLGQDANGNQGSLADLWRFDALSGEWTWMGGSTVAGTQGNYGSKGSGTALTAPGGRYGGAAWRDAAGNAWIFGGSGVDFQGTAGHLNDLWTLNASTLVWTWVSGSDAADSAANFGSLGVPAAANLPGGRLGATAWIDVNGLLALAGGQGIDSAGASGFLNDVWRYNPSAGTWTWTGGAKLANPSGTYGQLGVTASSNTPGGRYDAAQWVDLSGHLWIFGGLGYDAASLSSNHLGDLWTLVP